MIEFDFNNSSGTKEPVQIKIAGIGGAGTNVLDRLVIDGIENADLIALNTDAQSLTSSVAAEKVQLGRQTTRGLGAGGDPEVGFNACEEAVEEIGKAFEGAGMVFLCVGLGGGTGSGASPLIAQIARNQGALVIVFATVPFIFEGKRRKQQAEEALVSLQEYADVVICFENEKMGDAVAPKAGIHEAFSSADRTVSQSIRAICNLFNRPGLIRIGFDELSTVLRSQSARCLFGYGEADGDNRANDCLARALKNPLMDRGRLLADAQSVLVNVAGSTNMTLNEVNILMTELNRHVGDQTHILFGTAIDPKMGNRMSVTLVSAIGTGEVRKAEVRGRKAEIRKEEPVSPAPSETPSVTQESEALVTEVPEPAPLFVDSIDSIPFSPEPQPLPQEIESEEPVPAARHEDLQPAAQTPDLLDFDEEVVPAADPLPLDPIPAPAPITASAPVATPIISTVRPRQSALVKGGELNLNIQPSLSPSAAQKSLEIKQETLQFEPVTRGRFEKSEPTIVDGQDLDVPTFLRRNIRIK